LLCRGYVEHDRCDLGRGISLDIWPFFLAREKVYSSCVRSCMMLNSSETWPVEKENEMLVYRDETMYQMKRFYEELEKNGS